MPLSFGPALARPSLAGLDGGTRRPLRVGLLPSLGYGPPSAAAERHVSKCAHRRTNASLPQMYFPHHSLLLGDLCMVASSCGVPTSSVYTAVCALLFHVRPWRSCPSLCEPRCNCDLGQIATMGVVLLSGATYAALWRYLAGCKDSKFISIESWTLYVRSWMYSSLSRYQAGCFSRVGFAVCTWFSSFLLSFLFGSWHRNA